MKIACFISSHFVFYLFYFDKSFTLNTSSAKKLFKNLNISTDFSIYKSICMPIFKKTMSIHVNSDHESIVDDNSLQFLIEDLGVRGYIFRLNDRHVTMTSCANSMRIWLSYGRREMSSYLCQRPQQHACNTAILCLIDS